MASELVANQFDLVVVGSGPGGYVGAIRAAQLGMKVAVIEKDNTFGGTCLNVGCIPSKALLDSSEYFSLAKKDFASHGIDLSDVKLNLSQMLSRKGKVVQELTQGVAFLFKKNKIQSFQGVGRFVRPGVLSVGGQEILAKNVIIATGSVPNELKQAPFDGEYIVSSTEALSFKQVPEHLVVVGGGYIGLELGSVWCRLGAKVTVVEYSGHICGTMDRQISTLLQRSLAKQGFDFKLSTELLEAKVDPKLKKVIVRASKVGDAKETIELQADRVLVAAGRRPYTEGLGLENIGVKVEGGRIQVDEHFQTNVNNVYAIGDVIRGPMLAHKAEEEGVAVAELLAGQAGHVNYDTVPGIIYTWPEVASVGLTEEQVKEKGMPYKVGTFPFMANGRAKALGFTEGLAKVIADEETDRLIGVHIIGPRASDMIAEAVAVMEFGGSSEDLARCFHAHPTFSEVLREAALNVDKLARQA